MHHVRLAKHDGDITVGVGRVVMPERDRQAVKLEIALAIEGLGREPSRRQREEIVVPVLDALHLGQIVSRPLLRDDFGARRVEPGIPIGMVEVPMAVDQMADRVSAQRRERLGKLWPRHADTRIDQHLAVWAGDDADVAARPLEHGDVVSELMDADR